MISETGAALTGSTGAVLTRVWKDSWSGWLYKEEGFIVFCDITEEDD